MLRHMRDFGFGTRSATLENLMQQEIQDVVDVLNGRKEDKVCLQQTVFACDSKLKILFCSSQAISLLIVHGPHLISVLSNNTLNSEDTCWEMTPCSLADKMCA